MKEQFELFVDFMKERGMKPSQERILRRQFLRMELMQEIHRPASSCPQELIDAEIKHAQDRLKRERYKAEPITPDRPAKWQTARLVTPALPERKSSCPSLDKQRNHIASQSPRNRKDWGKGGVKLINTISRAKANRKKLEHDLAYFNAMNG